MLRRQQMCLEKVIEKGILDPSEQFLLIGLLSLVKRLNEEHEKDFEKNTICIN
jgi:hypothetical protein